MIISKTIKEGEVSFITRKLADYSQLVKLRLSSLVVFSAGVTFLYASLGHTAGSGALVSPGINWARFLLLALGGFLVTGSSNALNQILERDLDRLMHRTRERPIPNYRMQPAEGLLIAFFMGAAGLLIVYYLNPLTSFLSLFALLSYAFVYTPLKQATSLSVYVGAIPGAMPTLIGWAAATGHITQPALIIFLLQFVWQFPHFWSIAWVLDDDYRRAGFKMMPAGGNRDQKSALYILISAALLIPVSLIPSTQHMGGYFLAVVSLCSGILFLLQAIRLYTKCTIKSASRVMLGSFIYLPVVQLALLIDRLF